MSARAKGSAAGTPFVLLVVATVLVALSLRPGASAVVPVLYEIRTGLGMGGGAAVLAAVDNSKAKAVAAVYPANVAPSAVEAARTRCADRANTDIRQGAVPADWPAGRFDLIVLSVVFRAVRYDGFTGDEEPARPVPD